MKKTPQRLISTQRIEEQNPPSGRIFLTEASKKLKTKRFAESLLEALKRAED